MELSLSRRAISSSVTKKIPKMLWNPKVYYCVHKNPLLVSIVSHINPAHTAISLYFLNVIHKRIVIYEPLLKQLEEYSLYLTNTKHINIKF
jgi:hypothetical protein